MAKPGRDRSSPSAFKGNTAGAGSTDGFAPAFTFDQMRAGSGYSVTCMEAADQAALAQQLFLLSSMTWLSIKNAGRHGLGSETIAISAIKVPLPPLTDDVTLLAIRFSGKKPMIGYRDGRIFHVLLLDHTFTCYKH